MLKILGTIVVLLVKTVKVKYPTMTLHIFSGMVRHNVYDYGDVLIVESLNKISELVTLTTKLRAFHSVTALNSHGK